MITQIFNRLLPFDNYCQSFKISAPSLRLWNAHCNVTFWIHFEPSQLIGQNLKDNTVLHYQGLLSYQNQVH